MNSVAPPKTNRYTGPSEAEVVTMHAFNAPRAKVWHAMTDTDNVQRWWGRQGSTLPICEIDLRVGGEWRCVEWSDDGIEYPFHGNYNEIVTAERLAYSFTFGVEPYTDKPCAVTLTLDEEEGGRTLMISTMRFAASEDRDDLFAAQMARGAREAYERLSAYLESLS